MRGGWEATPARTPITFEAGVRGAPEPFSPARPMDTLCYQETTRRGAGAGRTMHPPGTAPLSSPTSPLSPLSTPDKALLRPLAHFVPPALKADPAKAENEKHVPGRFEWSVMESFQFGEPPSPTSRTQRAPPLGTVMRAPKDPNDQKTEKVMPRFHALIIQLIRLTGDNDSSKRGDLLPHLSVSDVVRQVVKRLNWFSDLGAASSPVFKPVWCCFTDLMRSVFGGRLGKDVKQTALTDLLGCVFDIELMPQVVPVDQRELTVVRDRIYGHSCPTACVSALLSMMRHQHTESAHLNDTRSVGVVVSGIVAMANRVDEFKDGDPFPVLKELQRFCDYPDQAHGVDLFTRLSREGFSVGDNPAATGQRPSPLGAVRVLAAAIQAKWGNEVVTSVLASLATGGRSTKLAHLFTPCAVRYDSRRGPAIRRGQDSPASPRMLTAPCLKTHQRPQYPAQNWRPAVATTPATVTSPRTARGQQRACQSPLSTPNTTPALPRSPPYQSNSMCRPDASWRPEIAAPQTQRQPPRQDPTHRDTGSRVQELDWYEKQAAVQRRIAISIAPRGNTQYHASGPRREPHTSHMQWTSQTA